MNITADALNPRGHHGMEIDDLSEFTTFKQRRRSNSTSHVEQITSKFEVREDEPVFEEEMAAAERAERNGAGRNGAEVKA